MEISDKVLKYTAAVLFFLIVSLLIFGGIKKWSYDKQITELQNSLASKDKTIEIHKGVYEKLSIETDDLKNKLDQRDVQIKMLLKDLKNSGEELLTANTMSFKWKKAYEGLANATQTPLPNSQQGGLQRDKVEFAKEWSYIRASGYTITNPPEAYVKVEQMRPLKVSVTVGQKEDGSWNSRVTSSEENVDVDISLAAVNPKMFDKKWYERLGASIDLGVSSNGFLGGVGVSLLLANVDIGPKVWLTIGDNGVHPFYGAAATWHPWAR
jgi:hypothetical protein